MLVSVFPASAFAGEIETPIDNYDLPELGSVTIASGEATVEAGTRLTAVCEGFTGGVSCQWQSGVGIDSMADIAGETNLQYETTADDIGKLICVAVTESGASDPIYSNIVKVVASEPPGQPEGSIYVNWSGTELSDVLFWCGDTPQAVVSGQPFYWPAAPAEVKLTFTPSGRFRGLNMNMSTVYGVFDIFCSAEDNGYDLYPTPDAEGNWTLFFVSAEELAYMYEYESDSVPMEMTFTPVIGDILTVEYDSSVGDIKDVTGGGEGTPVRAGYAYTPVVGQPVSYLVVPDDENYDWSSFRYDVCAYDAGGVRSEVNFTYDDETHIITFTPEAGYDYKVSTFWTPEALAYILLQPEAGEHCFYISAQEYNGDDFGSVAVYWPAAGNDEELDEELAALAAKLDTDRAGAAAWLEEHTAARQMGNYYDVKVVIPDDTVDHLWLDMSGLKAGYAFGSAWPEGADDYYNEWSVAPDGRIRVYEACEEGSEDTLMNVQIVPAGIAAGFDDNCFRLTVIRNGEPDCDLKPYENRYCYAEHGVTEEDTLTVRIERLDDGPFYGVDMAGTNGERRYISVFDPQITWLENETQDEIYGWEYTFSTADYAHGWLFEPVNWDMIMPYAFMLRYNEWAYSYSLNGEVCGDNWMSMVPEDMGESVTFVRGAGRGQERDEIPAAVKIVYFDSDDPVFWRADTGYSDNADGFTFDPNTGNVTLSAANMMRGPDIRFYSDISEFLMDELSVDANSSIIMLGQYSENDSGSCRLGFEDAEGLEWRGTSDGGAARAKVPWDMKYVTIVIDNIDAGCHFERLEYNNGVLFPEDMYEYDPETGKLTIDRTFYGIGGLGAFNWIDLCVVISQDPGITVAIYGNEPRTVSYEAVYNGTQVIGSVGFDGENWTEGAYEENNWFYYSIPADAGSTVTLTAFAGPQDYGDEITALKIYGWPSTIIGGNPHYDQDDNFVSFTATLDVPEWGDTVEFVTYDILYGDQFVVQTKNPSQGSVSILDASGEEHAVEYYDWNNSCSYTYQKDAFADEDGNITFVIRPFSSSADVPVASIWWQDYEDYDDIALTPHTDEGTGRTYYTVTVSPVERDGEPVWTGFELTVWFGRDHYTADRMERPQEGAYTQLEISAGGLGELEVTCGGEPVEGAGYETGDGSYNFRCYVAAGTEQLAVTFIPWEGSRLNNINIWSYEDSWSYKADADFLMDEREMPDAEFSVDPESGYWVLTFDLDPDCSYYDIRGEFEGDRVPKINFRSDYGFWFILGDRDERYWNLWQAYGPGVGYTVSYADENEDLTYISVFDGESVAFYTPEDFTSGDYDFLGCFERSGIGYYSLTVTPTQEQYDNMRCITVTPCNEEPPASGYASVSFDENGKVEYNGTNVRCWSDEEDNSFAVAPDQPFVLKLTPPYGTVYDTASDNVLDHGPAARVQLLGAPNNDSVILEPVNGEYLLEIDKFPGAEYLIDIYWNAKEWDYHNYWMNCWTDDGWMYGMLNYTWNDMPGSVPVEYVGATYKDSPVKNWGNMGRTCIDGDLKTLSFTLAYDISPDDLELWNDGRVLELGTDYQISGRSVTVTFLGLKELDTAQYNLWFSYDPGEENVINEETGKTYERLSRALNEAEPGDTVTLLKPAAYNGEFEVVRPGVTLDLNGYAVEAGTFVCFGSVIDSTESYNSATKAYTPGTGKLWIDKSSFAYMYNDSSVAAGTAQIPYYDGEGFRFATITRFGSKWSENLNAEGKSKFIFYPIISDWTNTVWKDVLAEGSGVGVYIHAEIVTAADTLIYEFVYTDELMASWANGIDSTGCGTYMLKAKADDSIKSITVRPYVKSAYSNLTIYGDEKTTSAP